MIRCVDPWEASSQFERAFTTISEKSPHSGQGDFGEIALPAETFIEFCFGQHFDAQ
jgi:hypothetical protein